MGPFKLLLSISKNRLLSLADAVSAWWKRQNLSVKTNLGVLSLLIVLFSITGYILLGYFSSILISNTERRGEIIGSLFAKINNLPLDYTDYFALENSARELLAIEDMEVAEIYDKDNVKLTIVQKENNKTASIYYHNNDIINKYGVLIGQSRVGISLDRTKKQIHTVAIVLFIIMTFSLVLTAFAITYLISRIINKPLFNLLTPIKMITKGDLSHRINVKANDEIGEISINFNIMTEQLNISLSLINNIISAMPSILFSVDREFRITQWNNAAEVFTCRVKSDVFNMVLWDACDHFNNLREYIESVFATRKPEELYRIRLSSKPEMIKNVSIFPIYEKEISGAVIRIDDVTELESKESQLRQMQKMELIGNITGGIAHDFNNVLGGIIGSVSLLKYNMSHDRIIDNHALTESLNIIDGASKRAADLVRQLLSFSRNQDVKKIPVSINASVLNVINLCRNTFDKCIEIQHNPHADRFHVSGDPTQIEQVLLNICINSGHAMTIMRSENDQQGGVLSVTIKTIDIDRHFRNFHPDANRTKYICISISDTGIGMDQETVSKIFDPFFTTKEKGTGLGLSMVYNIINSHDGFIDVCSNKGVGTTTNIYLPVSETAETDALETEEKIYRGTGTILLIDDEDMIRKTAGGMLTECGYTVLNAENGIIGIELFKEKLKNITLVITDMSMPVMSGLEIFNEIKKIKPGIKVILVSGYKQDKRVIACIEQGADFFIQKPFTMKELSKAVYDVLNT